MIINYDIEMLQKTLSDFNIATGVTIDLLKEDFTPVVQNRMVFRGYCSQIQSTETGKNACQMSDQLLLQRCKSSRQTELHFCPAGLIDVVSPIVLGEKIVGYLIFGQLRSNLEFDVLEEYIEELGLDPSLMAALYKNTVYYDTQRIECLCNIASMMIRYILFMNMLRPSVDTSLQAALTYIDANLHNELSILSISKATGVSKSALYKKFHASLGCTVNEYINRKRVEYAISLIQNTAFSMDAISQKAGFSSLSYFSRTFKRLKGISPVNFKKSCRP